MSTLGLVLIQFMFRLGFGVALTMCFTSPRAVASGYYRTQYWMLLGFYTFTAMLGFTGGADLPNQQLIAVLATVAAFLSYVGSIVWLYDLKRTGIVLTALVCLVSVAGGVAATPDAFASAGRFLLVLADITTAGFLLGAFLAAMLLGHWYLNNPSMKLAPLKRLTIFAGVSVAARAVLCAAGLLLLARETGGWETNWWIFVSLRWISGMVLTAVLAVLTWHTLKIPNTQSATGILYAGVILAFIGELTSQLLSADVAYPL